MDRDTFNQKINEADTLKHSQTYFVSMTLMEMVTTFSAQRHDYWTFETIVNHFSPDGSNRRITLSEFYKESRWEAETMFGFYRLMEFPEFVDPICIEAKPSTFIGPVYPSSEYLDGVYYSIHPGRARMMLGTAHHERMDVVIRCLEGVGIESLRKRGLNPVKCEDYTLKHYDLQVDWRKGHHVGGNFKLMHLLWYRNEHPEFDDMPIELKDGSFYINDIEFFKRRWTLT